MDGNENKIKFLKWNVNTASNIKESTTKKNWWGKILVKIIIDAQIISQDNLG